MWIRFKDSAEYGEKRQKLYDTIAASDGHDKVIIYCEKERNRIQLPDSQDIRITPELLAELRNLYGEKNVETT